MSELRDYIRFSSTNPAFDFSFLYPASWQAREVKTAEGDEVSIIGPRNRDNTYSVGLAIRVISMVEGGRRYTSLEELVAAHLARSKRAAKYQEILRAQGIVAGLDAIEIETSYSLPLPMQSIRPKDTVIVERRVYLKRGNSFYELMYRAVEEDYYAYLDVFKDVVHTFLFRADRVRMTHQPFVAQAVIRAMREKPSIYEEDQ